jgi:hypothetical protein
MGKRAALAKYLGCRKRGISTDNWDDSLFSSYGRKEYLVLTDEEANERAKEYIRESLWTFNSTFLSCQTGIDSLVFEKLSKLYESGNEAILSIVEQTVGLDGLVEDAIACDGRGHFLNHWDGTEDEIEWKGDYLYIYRVN